MNRGIKFRARAIQNGQWIVGDLIHKRHNGDEEVIIQEPNGCGTDCDINTVGQFTGLKDKNGQEIYEGDFLKKDFGSQILTVRVGWSEYQARYTLAIIDGDNEDVGALDSFEARHAVVIGNIHENQELMSGWPPMKIHSGLWYLCRRTLRHFRKHYWYYSTADGRLKGDDKQPHEISDYIATRYFGDGMELRIAEPQKK